MLLVPWIAFTALFGYLGERLTEFNSIVILAIGGGISLIVVFFLNFYVLVPLKNADATISSSEKDMEGQVAKVVKTIPISGMGEIQLQSVTGSHSRPAAFYSPQAAEVRNGELVLIIEIRERVCYVVPYKQEFV